MHERRKEKESITINWSSLSLLFLCLFLLSLRWCFKEEREREDKANRKDPNDPPLLLPIAIQLMVSEDSTGAAGLILWGEEKRRKSPRRGLSFCFLSFKRSRSRSRSKSTARLLSSSFFTHFARSLLLFLEESISFFKRHLFSSTSLPFLLCNLPTMSAARRLVPLLDR